MVPDPPNNAQDDPPKGSQENKPDAGTPPAAPPGGTPPDPGAAAGRGAGDGEPPKPTDEEFKASFTKFKQISGDLLFEQAKQMKMSPEAWAAELQRLAKLGHDAETERREPEVTPAAGKPTAEDDFTEAIKKTAEELDVKPELLQNFTDLVVKRTLKTMKPITEGYVGLEMDRKWTGFVSAMKAQDATFNPSPELKAALEKEVGDLLHDAPQLYRGRRDVYKIAYYALLDRDPNSVKRMLAAVRSSETERKDKTDQLNVDGAPPKPAPPTKTTREDRIKEGLFGKV